MGNDNLGILLLCAFVRSLGQGIQTPAVGAFIPQIVPEKRLTRVNGFQSSVQSFVTLTSPMLSGALMTFAPLETLFFLDVITASISIVILFFFVKIPENEKTEIQVSEQKARSYFYDLKEGIKYIKNHRFMLRLMIFSAMLFFYSPLLRY